MMIMMIYVWMLDKKGGKKDVFVICKYRFFSSFFFSFLFLKYFKFWTFFFEFQVLNKGFIISCFIYLNLMVLEGNI